MRGNVATTPVTITAVPTAIINYSGPFCKSVSAGQLVSLTGTGAFTGGTFTSTPSGLNINSTTGTIIPSTSIAGGYTVTYSIPASGGCAASSVSTFVAITDVPTASITNAGPYCNTITSLQNITLTGTGAFNSGTFTASPAGLSIDPSTGKVNPSLSAPNTYNVLYTIPASGGCNPTSASTTLTIIAGPSATISYAGPFCQSINTVRNVIMTGTGAYTGGTFSSTPSGLSINTSTGDILPSSSIAGTYTINYTLPPSSGCASTPVNSTTVTITTPPTAAMHYPLGICKSTLFHKVRV